MDDWQCRDKSPSGFSEGACVKFTFCYFSRMRSPDVKPRPSNLQEQPVCFLFMPGWRSALGEFQLTGWGVTSPKFNPRPHPTAPPAPRPSSLQPPLRTALPSLYGLLIGCAARVLRLHNVGELRRSGEGLDPQLLERIIWERRTREETWTPRTRGGERTAGRRDNGRETYR